MCVYFIIAIYGLFFVVLCVKMYIYRKKFMYLCVLYILYYMYYIHISEENKKIYYIVPLYYSMEIYMVYERVKLGVFIDRKVVEKLRELISLKYKKYEKGLLSYEVEQALRNWIALHTNTHKISIPNPPSKTAIVFAQIKSYLETNYYIDGLRTGMQIPVKHIVEAIASVRGGDRRTIRRWLKEFERYKLIKPITHKLYEVL